MPCRQTGLCSCILILRLRLLRRECFFTTSTCTGVQPSLVCVFAVMQLIEVCGQDLRCTTAPNER